MLFRSPFSFFCMFEPFPDLFSRKDSAHTFPPVSRTVCCFAFNTIHRIILDVNKSWGSLKYLKTSSKYLQKAAAAEVTPPQQPLFQAQMNINNTLLPFFHTRAPTPDCNNASVSDTGRSVPVPLLHGQFYNPPAPGRPPQIGRASCRERV